ncbi:MAG: PDZ domain-containing protein, partial [Pseudoalteromonas sp.]
KAQQLDVKQGAYVMQVMDDTAASKAGIKAGDVIVSINGGDISGFHELRSKIATLGEGREIKLGIYRDGKIKTVKVTLDGASGVTATGEELHPAFQGATLENVQKNSNKGVEVTSVDPRSPSARVGLEEGDIIMQVNRQRVETIRDMNKIIENTKGNIVLGVQRGRESIFILIQ